MFRFNRSVILLALVLLPCAAARAQTTSRTVALEPFGYRWFRAHGERR